jgi:hypothetical protein
MPQDAAGIGQSDVRVSIADVKKRSHQFPEILLKEWSAV